MNATTTSVGQMRSQCATVWVPLLLCLSAPACFRSPDTSKIPCVEAANCPNGYHCAKPQGTNQGTCAPGPASADGSITDLSTLAGLGGKGGGLADAALGIDTSDARTANADSMLFDVSPGGTGGVGGSAGSAASGGSTSSGGTTSAPDAPSGAGGTTSPPDAPITNDVSDAPTTLPNGSACMVHDQCSSGFCVDGHCCNSNCDGNCASCATGTCSFTSTPRTPCAGSGKCAGICDKSNTKACTFDNTTVCAAQSCSSGVRTNKSICDGQGNCPAPTTTTCNGNQCAADGNDCATCTDEPTATTCAGGHCGPTANNCGHTVQCSTTCTGNYQTCGGGGVTGMCGCTSVSTSQTCGTSNCGTPTDNCGKQVSCGTCSGSNTCGGGGTANVCGCTTNSNGCVGRACGSASDGCTGTITCGSYSGGCQTGYQCNTTTGQCSCVPNNNACVGRACGTASDGCTGTIACGSYNGGCQTGYQCNTTTGQCSCVPNNNACTGRQCGTASDGCTGTIACGSYNGGCQTGYQCNTTTGQCSCVPNPSPCGTRVCGSVSNGCGGTTSCGTCATGQSCDGNGKCQCNSGATSVCGGCLSWGFESGTQGWGIDTSMYGVNPGAIILGRVSQSASQHHSGSYSLSFYTQFDGQVTIDATVAVNVCAAATNVYGLQVSGYVMAVPDTGYSTLPNNILSVYSDAMAPVIQLGIHSVNTWIPFVGTFTLSPGSLTFLGLDFKVTGAAWNGTLYVDDVTIAAP